MAETLTGTADIIPLGQGCSIYAPGITGTAELLPARTANDRRRAPNGDDGTQEFRTAFEQTGMIELQEVELHLDPTTPAGAVRSVRSSDGAGIEMELNVPDPGPEYGQVVLVVDESGAMSWQLPLGDDLKVETPVTRGSGGVKRFRIPGQQPAVTPRGGQPNRSLFGIAGRKLLKVFIYPVTDAIIGPIGSYFAEKFEEKRRPYGIRTFNAQNYQAPVGDEITTDEWRRLGAGPALLFVHGTFSTAHSAFFSLPASVMQELATRYAGRVFAFNHFTLSHDPARNVEWFLGKVPADVNLELDIICHSRGGLVSRTLAEHASSFGMDASKVRVRKIVHVGVPNQGTLLADPDHMVKMIDRLTTGLNMVPAGPVSDILEVMLTGLKVIGHGAVKSLKGIASMHPTSPFLGKINQPAPRQAELYGIASNYEPADEGMKALVSGAVDSIVDRIFLNAANDLVVPEEGVYSDNGCDTFPIPDDRLLRIAKAEAVMHTTIFGHAAAQEKLLSWLS